MTVVHLILRDAGNGAETIYASTDREARDHALLELVLCCERGVRCWPDVARVGDRAIVDHCIETAMADRDEAVQAGWGG